jgi:polyphosphate kinase
MAVVQAPRPLPRLIQLPQELEGTGPEDYVFLSSVIHAYVDSLFPGMKVTGCYQFRVTRNSELFVDEEEVDDLKRALEGELASRRYGEAVRLEVANDCPEEIINYLLVQFSLRRPDIYQVNGPVNLNRLSAVCDMVDRTDLKFPSFTPGLPKGLTHKADIFSQIRKNDILLHHPYESFSPVVDFVVQAASDPDVLAIKQTLYRSGSESNIVDALIHAARTGKEVVVIIELRARFDEADNIALATRLQEAGAHVVYGIVGYKTHAKMNLVVRREGNSMRRYVHLGTGNYHVKNVRVYTDYGLLTCDEDIGKDVHEVFMQLTSLGKVTKLNKLLQSPFTLNDAVIKMIHREISHAEEGKPAHIIAKINALVDKEIISTLYDASRAGVEIDLIVRGICCLKPGIPGLSDNIRVRSIIGRFLEHHRVYYFQNDKKPDVFCASADWMERNLHQRVEVCFPIENEKIRKRLINDLKLYLQDNVQSWELQADGSYQRIAPENDEGTCSAQQALLEKYAEDY